MLPETLPELESYLACGSVGYVADGVGYGGGETRGETPLLDDGKGDVYDSVVVGCRVEFAAVTVLEEDFSKLEFDSLNLAAHGSYIIDMGMDGEGEAVKAATDGFPG